MSSEDRQFSLAELTVGMTLLFKEIIEILEREKLTDRAEVLEILDRGIRSSPESRNLFLSILKDNFGGQMAPESKPAPKLTIVQSGESEV